LIIGNVFLDQGTTLFNLQLCLVDYVDGSNNNFVILVCGLNHWWKYVGLFAFYSCVSKCSWSSWMMHMCKHRYNWCYLMLDIFMKNGRQTWRLLRKSLRFIKFIYGCCALPYYFGMLLRIWYEVITKKLLHERMCKINKVLVFLHVTFWYIITIPFHLKSHT
jgi:hypothetical protein